MDADRLRSAVQWRAGHLEIVDQTLLPGRFQVRRLDTFDELLDAIRRLAVRGAPALGVCGAFGVVVGLAERDLPDAGSARRELAKVVAAVVGARPTAVNLGWGARRVAGAAAAGRTPAEMRRLALQEAQRVLDEDRESCRRMGAFGREELASLPGPRPGGRGTPSLIGAPLRGSPNPSGGFPGPLPRDRGTPLGFPGPLRVLTHCNTGRLATAGLGSALGVVYTMAAAGDPVEVYASETRPLLQGARLTAWELVDAGIPVTVLPDAATGAALAGGRVDVVLVGCDRVARNGDTANKVGTYNLAVLARASGVPFYVVGPLSSFDPDTPDGQAIAIEERAAAEVLQLAGAVLAPAGAEAWNPAFDVTPAAYVTAFITDAGVLRPPFAASIGRALAEAGR